MYCYKLYIGVYSSNIQLYRYTLQLYTCMHDTYQISISFLPEALQHLPKHRVVLEPQMHGGGRAVGHSFIIVQCMVDVWVLGPVSVHMCGIEGMGSLT